MVVVKTDEWWQCLPCLPHLSLSLHPRSTPWWWDLVSTLFVEELLFALLLLEPFFSAFFLLALLLLRLANNHMTCHRSHHNCSTWPCPCVNRCIFRQTQTKISYRSIHQRKNWRVYTNGKKTEGCWKHSQSQWQRGCEVARVVDWPFPLVLCCTDEYEMHDCTNSQLTRIWVR